MGAQLTKQDLTDVNQSVADCRAGSPRLGALIGKGFTSEVFSWDRSQVVKLFHPWVPHVKVDRELRVTCSIYAAGLPVPRACGLVQVLGREGIVFDHIDGNSMLRQVQGKPWTLFHAIRQLAQLHAQIHDCTGPVELPSLRQQVAEGIDHAPGLSDAERQAAHRSLAGLPDGAALCHGDFHPENILFSSRGPIIIDWATATRGDPLGDVACTSRLIRRASLPPWTPRPMHLLLKFSRALLHRSYLTRYLQLRPGTLEEIRAWEAPLVAAAKAWRIPNTPVQTSYRSLSGRSI